MRFSIVQSAESTGMLQVLVQEAGSSTPSSCGSPIAAASRPAPAATRGHLDVEEQLLFPRVEAATGMHGHGPTVIMRSEHRQMRGLLDQVEVAARAGNSDEVLNLGDTLLMFTQQHNSTEEQVLYPLSARVLSQQWPEMTATRPEISCPRHSGSGLRVRTPS